MTMVQTSGQVNLSGAADDYTVAQKAVGLDATPQRAFGGDLQGSGLTFKAAMSSFSRCAVQACWSAK